MKVMAKHLSLIDVSLQWSLSLVSKIQPEINNKITYHSKKGAEGKQARMEGVHVGTAAQDTRKQVGHNDGTAW